MTIQIEAPRLRLWRKLLAGSDQRKTRLHDVIGGRIPLSRLVRNGPGALLTGAGRLLLGLRPERPWISYDAQAVLGRFLRREHAVLEFGSGMSTVWYARRAGQVVSIEDDQGWFGAVSARLEALGNVDYRFAVDRSGYTALDPDRTYDLIMIDGRWRDDCARVAIDRLRPGGIIYLDNCDMRVDELTGDIPLASHTLRTFARERGLRVRQFTDFAPTQLFVQRGLMIGG
jgi:hypothetical protein